MSFKRKSIINSVYEEDAKRASSLSSLSRFQTSRNENIATSNSATADADKQNNENTHTSTSSAVGDTFAETFVHLKETEEYKKETDNMVVKRKKTNSIIVNSRQRGNPLLKHIHNVPWEYGEIIPDYQIGEKSCSLFLSLRYHLLNPDYIHDRLKQLGACYELRILLVQVDVNESSHSLKELAKISILANVTLILAWSATEAGRYLETYKSLEHKPADSLLERVEASHTAQMQDVLTSIRSVNRTDVITLLDTFHTLSGIANASKQEIALCPGIGNMKAERIVSTFNQPFRKKTESQESSSAVREADIDDDDVS